MKLGEIPAAQYNPLAETFTANEFDARALARLARLAGMRYITLTTRLLDYAGPARGLA